WGDKEAAERCHRWTVRLSERWTRVEEAMNPLSHANLLPPPRRARVCEIVCLEAEHLATALRDPSPLTCLSDIPRAIVAQATVCFTDTCDALAGLVRTGEFDDFDMRRGAAAALTTNRTGQHPLQSLPPRRRGNPIREPSGPGHFAS